MNKDLLKIARKTFLYQQMFERSPEECGYTHIERKNNYFVFAKSDLVLKATCNYLGWQNLDAIIERTCFILVFMSLSCLFIGKLFISSTFLEFIGMTILIIIGICFPFYEIISGHKKEKYEEIFKEKSKFIIIPIDILNDIKAGKYEKENLPKKENK